MGTDEESCPLDSMKRALIAEVFFNDIVSTVMTNNRLVPQSEESVPVHFFTFQMRSPLFIPNKLPSL